nr:hypothetical protein [Sedimentibacter sp.]
MSNEITEQIEVKPSKKSIFMRWWFWLFIIIIIIIIGSLGAFGGGSITYELSRTSSMSRQDIIDKYGKPDEVLSDDSDGYLYGYDAGFIISGTDKGALEISLMSDSVKKNTSDNYKIMDVTLGSSFEENIKRLGEPALSTNDGQKGAMYLTNEDYILMFTTGYNSDSIEIIKFAYYDNSLEAITLDISSLLGNIVTEEDISKAYKINQKSPYAQSTMYDCKGFDLNVENKNDIVEQVIISEDGIFNICGIRIDSTLDEVKNVFGEPISSSEGVLNTTQYVFYDDGFIEKKIQVTIDNTTSKVEYIEASIQNDDYFESYDDPISDETDDLVYMVYNSYFDYYSEDETIGEAFDSFFTNAKWETNIVNGYNCVNFFGTLVDSNNTPLGAVGAIFQLSLDDSFELIEVYIGDEKINESEINDFLDLVYSN